MKRHISLILLVLLCLTPVSVRYWIQQAYGAECENACSEPVQLARANLAVLGASSGAAAPACAGVCCDSFDRGDNSDATAGAPITWTETDVDGKLSIISSYLNFNADTTGKVGYVTATTSCFASVPTHVTVKLVIRFVHASEGTLADLYQAISGANKALGFVKLLDGSNTVALVDLITNATGNLTIMRAYRYSGGVYQEAASVTISDLNTNTDYDVYLYFLKDATNGTVEVKIGSLTAGNTGTNDTSAEEVDTIKVGATSNAFGDGTNDVNIRYKNLVVYNTDAR